MAFRILLLTADTPTSVLFQELAQEINCELAVEQRADNVAARLSRKYDLVAIDCDDTHNALPVLRSVRTGAANRSASVLAIVNGATHPYDAHYGGADSVISKPLSMTDVRAEILRHSSILWRREHERVPVQVPIYVSFGSVVDRLGVTFNLCNGGVGIECDAGLDGRELLRMKFQLPGSEAPLQALGEVAWADSARYGVHFTSIGAPAKEKLLGWLNSAASTRLD